MPGIKGIISSELMDCIIETKNKYLKCAKKVRGGGLNLRCASVVLLNFVEFFKSPIVLDHTSFIHYLLLKFVYVCVK